MVGDLAKRGIIPSGDAGDFGGAPGSPAVGWGENEASEQYLRRAECIHGIAAWIAHGGKPEGGS